MSSGESEELAGAILEPHFDAVRDTFLEFEPEPGVRLDRLRRIKMVIDPAVHDTARHYARCRDDGMLIKVAPQAVELPWEMFVAITLHEFGHAVDFAYPASWVCSMEEDGGAVWIGDREDKPARKWRRLWHQRGDVQVEAAADSIVMAVTGVRVSYCGPCMVQCFSGADRPKGLR